jgi:uncharacterized membrane protein YdjX (TVP38/TMEM64 family)
VYRVKAKNSIRKYRIVEKMSKIFRFMKKYQMHFRVFGIVVFAALIAYVSIRYTAQIVSLFNQREQLKASIASKGAYGVLIFILFQILQIVVAAIPGEVVQIAGGYLYGTFLGTVYLSAGVIIGSTIVFYASRLLGYEFVKSFVPKDKMEKYFFKDNGHKFLIFSLVLFLIPGIPKDILTYIAGLTPVRPLRFLAVAVIGRLPALIASAYIGNVFEHRNYTAVVIVSVAAVLLFLLGLIYKDRIVNRLHAVIDAHKKDA